ncbi:Alpha/beta knot methyltransferase [Pelagophyceae sp. CCMP2097]|nr:Alpha/beta knot methyltransferase [Pelagophyceae sp. CCMP2097]
MSRYTGGFLRFVGCLCVYRARSFAPAKPLQQKMMCLWGTPASGEDLAAVASKSRDDVLRAADSAALVKELERRGIFVDEDASSLDGGDDAAPAKPKSSHVVGQLRPKDDLSDARQIDIDAALKRLGVVNGGKDLLPGPPFKAYNTFIRPRKPENGVKPQTVENAAHQIAFLNRHELARRDSHLRNTDDAARARDAKNLVPFPISIVLDNVRSAENVGSILRSADCGRCLEVVTCGFTPNAQSTSKIAKTAFGAEAAVPQRHFESTLEAVLSLKAQGVTVWALETVDDAKQYTNAPLPALPGGHVALVLGNEVTGVDQAVLAVVDALVEIPTYGTKNSMNVACCASIVIFDILRRWEKH